MKKALLVDSSEYWASALSKLLKEYDVEVVSWLRRGTGWQEIVSKTNLDYIFIDDQLPSRNGIRCLEILKEQEPFSAKIVFMHSVVGQASSQIEWAAWSRGAMSVLRKPFRRAELKKLLAFHRPAS